MGKAKSACCVVIAVIALFLLVTGLIAVFLVPKAVHQQIRDKLPLSSPASLVFPAWQDTDADKLDVERNFYFFNLTNPYDVYEWHAVPNFVPVGPFVYHEHTYNPLENISWKVDATIDFNYFTDLKFVKEKSIDARTGVQLTEDTHIVSPNMPFFGGMWRLGHLLEELRGTPFAIAAGMTICPAMNKTVGDNIVGKTGVFTNRSAGELLNGYEDPLWVIMNELAALVDYKVPTYFRAIFNHSQPAPSPWSYRYGQQCPMWNDRKQCNSSGENTNTVFSGASWKLAAQVDTDGTEVEGKKVEHGAFSKLSEFKQWAGQEEMWWWGDEEDGQCRKFEGSNGMMFPAGLDEDSKPWVFFDALFRKLQLEFKEKSVNHGLPTLRFRLDKKGQKAGPHTKCYGQRYDSLMNLTAPMFGPAYISYPFFEEMDTTEKNHEVHDRDIPIVNVTIEGLPVATWKMVNEMTGGTELDIEPLTGTLMEAHARVQFNSLMREVTLPAPAPGKCENMFPFMKPKTVTNPHTGVTTENSHFPHTVFPFFYLDRHAIMPQDLADKLHRDVILPLSLSKYAGVALVVVSAIAFLIGVCCACVRSKTNPEEEYLTEASLGKSTNGYVNGKV